MLRQEERKDGRKRRGRKEGMKEKNNNPAELKSLEEVCVCGVWNRTQKDPELDRDVLYDWHHNESLWCLFLSMVDPSSPEDAG